MLPDLTSAKETILGVFHFKCLDIAIKKNSAFIIAHNEQALLLASEVEGHNFSWCCGFGGAGECYKTHVNTMTSS